VARGEGCEVEEGVEEAAEEEVGEEVFEVGGLEEGVL
jgi:hypothetical protein